MTNEANKLPTAEQIRGWLGEEWEFMAPNFGGLSRSMSPWYFVTQGWTLYLRNKTTGQRVSVRAPSSIAAPAGHFIQAWCKHMREEISPDDYPGSEFSKCVTVHDAPATDVCELKHLVGQWVEPVGDWVPSRESMQPELKPPFFVESVCSNYADLRDSKGAKGFKARHFEARRVAAPDRTYHLHDAQRRFHESFAEDTLVGMTGCQVRKQALRTAAEQGAKFDPEEPIDIPGKLKRLKEKMQPPAVCSDCGCPDSKYTELEECMGELLCRDCEIALNATPGHEPTHPTPPEPEEPGPHDWDCFATSDWEWP